MKNYVYFVFIFLVFTACSVKKKPTFLKLDDVKVVSFKNDTIRLTANAFFKNENNVSGKMSTENMKVFVDGKDVAEVTVEEFKVPARKEFAMPLNVMVPANKVFKGGVLKGLLNSFLSDKLQVQFLGDIKYKVLGFSSTYKVDKTKPIKIKF